MSEKKSVRSRGWCFTVNNYDDDDIGYVMSLYEDDDNCTYLVIGNENGSRKKQPHLQCYIYYTNAISWKTAFNVFSPYHFEAQRARKNVEAYAYCMEGGKYAEFGERPRQGHRTDLEIIKHDILAGRPMIEISKNYFSQYVQYRRGFDAFKEMQIKYDTKLIVYDSDDLSNSMRTIYDDYSLVDSHILFSRYDMMITQLMSMFYSKKYKYIFIPSADWPKCVDENVSIVI